MKFKSSNFIIYLGSAYLIILLVCIYFIWSNLDISDFTSYDLIRENREIILGYKEKTTPLPLSISEPILAGSPKPDMIKEKKLYN